MVTLPLCISQIFIFCTNEMILLMHPLPRAYWQKQLKSESAPGGKQKMFLEILQNSQKNTCDRVSFLNKVATLLKKRLWHRYFPLNFAKLLRTPFLQNTSGQLPL